MYSVILMAALAAGGEAPDQFFRHHGGCHGGHGCYGSCYGGCSGFYYGGCHGCCGGCYGGDCYGGCHGCFGGYSFSYGCCGGCCGGGCCGGCYGVTSYYGCCGGCCGGGCYGSCYGGCFGCYGGVPDFHTAPAYGPTLGPEVVPGPATPGTVVPSTPVVPGTPIMPPAKPDGTSSKKDDRPEVRAASRARLVVEVPADAKLYIDDTLMRTPSARRAFATPTLDETQTYYYDVRVEVERGGKVLSETRRITLRAGDEIRTGFTETTVAAAAARAETAVAKAKAKKADKAEALTAARGR